MSKYNITKDTLALIGKNRNMVHIIETKHSYHIEDKIINILDYNCNYYGSSYIGRITGTKNIIGLNSKLPIIIEESNNIIFFPLSSTRDDRCIWINLANLSQINKCGKNTQICFTNGSTIQVDKSYYTVNNQLKKAKLLKEIMNTRKNEMYQEKIII